MTDALTDLFFLSSLLLPKFCLLTFWLLSLLPPQNWLASPCIMSLCLFCTWSRLIEHRLPYLFLRAASRGNKLDCKHSRMFFLFWSIDQSYCYYSGKSGFQFGNSCCTFSSSSMTICRGDFSSISNIKKLEIHTNHPMVYLPSYALLPSSIVIPDSPEPPGFTAASGGNYRISCSLCSSLSFLRTSISRSSGGTTACTISGGSPPLWSLSDSQSLLNIQRTLFLSVLMRSVALCSIRMYSFFV